MFKENNLETMAIYAVITTASVLAIYFGIKHRRKPDGS